MVRSDFQLKKSKAFPVWLAYRRGVFDTLIHIKWISNDAQVLHGVTWCTMHHTHSQRNSHSRKKNLHLAHASSGPSYI